jgi:hypothetical protein
MREFEIYISIGFLTKQIDKDSTPRQDLKKLTVQLQILYIVLGVYIC